MIGEPIVRKVSQGKYNLQVGKNYFAGRTLDITTIELNQKILAITKQIAYDIFITDEEGQLSLWKRIFSPTAVEYVDNQ